MKNQLYKEDKIIHLKKEKIKNLHDKIYNSMVKNSNYSNYDYIKYEKRND